MRLTMLTLLLFGAAVLTAQNVLHVNPAFNDGVSSFSSLQDAIDAASEGDEIRVYPGGYGGTTVVDKRLSIIGRGYNIYENYPGSNTILTNARVTRLDVEATAAGTLVLGLDIVDLRIKGADNCVVDRNKIGALTAYSANTILIRRNYFHGGSYSAYSRIPIGSCATSTANVGAKIITSQMGSIVIRNNIIEGGNTSYYTFIDNSCGSGINSPLIEFEYNYSNLRLTFPQTSLYMANNQLNTSTVPALTAFEDFGVIVRNIARLNVPSDNIAISTFSTELVFGDNSFDGRYQLLPSAQSRNYATDGGDIGPFGGPNPYILSGVTALPFIYELNVPDAGSTGGGINVNVKVKTQN